MLHTRMLVSLLAAAVMLAAAAATTAEAQQGQPTDWNRFFYYPYIYYPHNFRRPRSYNHLYYRYPPSRRIPVYNESWHNFYPRPRPYHSGQHFILDVF